MPSPQWSFSLFPGRVARRAFAARWAGGSGSLSLPRSAHGAGLARQAVRWMDAGSDGRRKAPLSAAAAGLKWPDRCLKPRSGTFCCARCTRNRPLGRAFPVRIVNGFHPPKVAKRKLTPRGGVAARSPPALFRKRAFEDRKRAPHDRKRGNAASSKVPAGVFERRPCLFSRRFRRARGEKAAKAPFFASQHASRDPFAIALALMTPPHFRAKPVPPRPANVHRPRDR